MANIDWPTDMTGRQVDPKANNNAKLQNYKLKTNQACDTNKSLLFVSQLASLICFKLKGRKNVFSSQLVWQCCMFAADITKNIAVTKIRYDSIRDAILTCARKPT